MYLKKKHFVDNNLSRLGNKTKHIYKLIIIIKKVINHLIIY